MARLLLRAGLVALAVVLAAGCSRAFFHPLRILPVTPDEAGLVWEDVWFVASDGVRLHGWYLPAEGPRRGTVLFLHGNGGNVGTQLGSVHWLPAAGYDVFMPDYRGYGRSAGTPSVEGAVRDAEAALAWLAARREVVATGVVVFGQSLGGAIAVGALTGQEEPRTVVRGVVLDSSFASYRRIAREKLRAFRPTWPLHVPLSLLVADGFSPADRIGRLAPVPVLIVHGADDGIVPFAHAGALYRAAGEPRALWRVADAGHIAALRRPAERDRLLAWLDRAFAVPPEP